MLETLQADLSRYIAIPDAPRNPWAKVRALAQAQGIWATAVYRFGQWSRRSAPKPLRPLLKAGYLAAFKLAEIATGISLPVGAQIGKGLYIGHFGGIIIHPDTVIGEGCSIAHGVTIGVRGGPRPGVPRIGNGVYIGCGAKLLGDITVGDGAIIGANAVVLRDVPAGATAVGVPARILPQRAHVSLATGNGT
jgi:serine O-acetyltransferase